MFHCYQHRYFRFTYFSPAWSPLFLMHLTSDLQDCTQLHTTQFLNFGFVFNHDLG